MTHGGPVLAFAYPVLHLVLVIMFDCPPADFHHASAAWGNAAAPC